MTKLNVGGSRHMRNAAVVPICGFVTPLGGGRTYRQVVPGGSAEAFPALARRLGRIPTWIFTGGRSGSAG